MKAEGVSLGSFVFWSLLLGWAGHVPVARLPWLPGDALIRVSTRFSLLFPLL